MIGQRETLAPAQVVDAVAREAERLARDQRHEVLVIELRGRLEQHAVAMARAPGLGAGRPRRVARRQLELPGVGRLVFLPGRDPAREGQLAEGLAQQRLFGGLGIEIHHVLGLELRQRLALHEQALHAEDRRELVVLFGQRARLGLDAEQLRHEVLELWRQRDQQFGFGLRRERLGRGTRREQRIAQRGVRGGDEVEKLLVEACQPVALVEVRKIEPERQLEHDPGVPQWRCATIRRCISAINLPCCKVTARRGGIFRDAQVPFRHAIATSTPAHGTAA